MSGPTIEEAFFCLMAMWASGNTESLLNVERRDRRPEQAKVKIKSSRRWRGVFLKTQWQVIKCIGT